MDKPICPVCGREMWITKSPSIPGWCCRHGEDGSGGFFGPGTDPDGTKVRAQIAAMEKRIHDSHPHTHGGDAVGASPLAPPATCGECVWHANVGNGVCRHGLEVRNLVMYAAPSATITTNTHMPSTTPACPAGVRRQA